MTTRLLASTRPMGATTRLTSVYLDYAARWGAVAFHKMDEVSDGSTNVSRLPTIGTTVLASSNTVPSAAGQVGLAASFLNTSSERLTAADNTEMSAAGDIGWIWSGWISLTSSGADRYFITKGTGVAASTLEWSLSFVNSSNRLRAQMGDSAGATITTATASNFGNVPTGTQLFVQVYHDEVNDLLGIRVNHGVANTAATAGRYAPDTAGDFYVGMRPGSGFLHGTVDESLWCKSPPLGVAAVHDEMSRILYNEAAGLAHPWSG